VTVGLVADSAASLSADEAARAGVVVVPMRLRVGEVDIDDGTRAPADLLAHLDARVTTAAPSPGRFADALAVADTGEGVVVLTVAKSMSASFEAARLAARLHPGPVRVVDTNTAAGAEGLVVLAAAERAGDGAGIDEVEERARTVAARVRLLATLDDLDHLARSGRVPGAVAWANRFLNLAPVFSFRHGKAVPRVPARSRRAAIEHMVHACASEATADACLHVAAIHGAEPAEADQLLARVREQVPDAIASETIMPFSGVMLAHTGPRLLGLAWWWERRSDAEDAG
jgi:DegV family protein with EDD domain